jgi:(R,R)-butanediol dehydrogenase / meso-butanediol dehydrogenase / diacetyl reductase
VTEKMQGLVYKGKENIVLEQIDLPVLNDGEALVKVAYTGICGSDVTIYEGNNPRVPIGTIIGHEISGEIAEIKGKDSSFKLNDRVVLEPIISCGKCFYCKTGDYPHCQNYKLLGVHTDGGFADYVKISVDRLHKIPENVSLKTAALTEPLAVATNAVRQSGLKFGDNSVVIGCGPIGLFVAHVARAAGANIIISDINDHRLDLAKKAGFNTIDVKVKNFEKEVKEIYKNIGPDIIFECAGTQSAINDSISTCRAKGQIVIVSTHKNLISADMRTIHLKELRLLGIKVYNFRDYWAAINFIASGKIDPELFISDVLPLSSFKKGLSMMKSGDNTLKVLLYPAKDNPETNKI